MLAGKVGKLTMIMAILENFVIQEADAGFASCLDDENELQCNTANAINCYGNVADKFGKGHFLPVPANREEYLTSVCQVSENSAEFPEDATCKDFYAGCTDAEKGQFSRMEKGYTELQKVATVTDVCQTVESLRECLNLDVLRRCALPPASSVGTSFARLTSRRRFAEKLKTCLRKSLNTCDSQKYGSAAKHLMRIADSIIDLNSLSVLGAVVGSGSERTGASAGVVLVAVISWFICRWC